MVRRSTPTSSRRRSTSRRPRGPSPNRRHCREALDPLAVDEHIAAIAQQAGTIDIELNATGPLISEHRHGRPVLDLTVDELMARRDDAAVPAHDRARRRQPHGPPGFGAIIFLTALPARLPLPGSAGVAAAYGAVEAVMRTMAVELGPAGVRAVCLRSHANLDTRSIQDTTVVNAGTAPALGRSGR